jgi:NitT/TauT family transport system substrate-binding protein
MTLLQRLCLALCLLLAQGGTSAAEQVKVAHLGLISDAPFYIALEEGYFAKRGLEVSLERFSSAAPAMAQVSNGGVQVVGGGLSPALFNAFARGFPVKIVAPRTREIEGRTISGLMLRSDLKDAIRRATDLKGRKVGLNAPGSPHVFILSRLLESEGLSLKDVDIIYLPFPDMRTAMLTKAIDAAIVSEPFITSYEGAGFAYTWKRTPAIISNPPLELAVIFYNSDWAEKNATAANDFMLAYMRGAQDFELASRNGKTRSRVIAILTKHTGVKDPVLYEKMQWPYTDPEGKVSFEGIRQQYDWYTKTSQVKAGLDVAKLFDERFVAYALKQLQSRPFD